MTTATSNWTNIQTCIQQDATWSWASDKVIQQGVQQASLVLEGFKASTVCWADWVFDDEFAKNANK
eukprot:14769922-Alexandrium_andersonii.AAC.1